MSRALFVRPEAEAEIAEASDWYDRANPGLGPNSFAPSTTLSQQFSKTHFNIKSFGGNSAAREWLVSLTA